MTWLNQFIESQAPPDNLIPNDIAYETKQASPQIKRPRIVTTMNDSINMDIAIVESVNVRS